MTKLGEFLEKKLVNKSQVARLTGIHKQRISQLALNESTKISAREVYLIAKAIDVDPCELLEYVCKGMELKEGEG